MALINCVDCGRTTSDQAAACPNCGHPVGSPQVQVPAVVTVHKNSHPVLTFIGGAVLVLLGLAAIGNAMDDDTPTKPAPAAPPPPAARFIATDALMDENCTQLGDYCVSVHCTYQNVGNAAGARPVTATLTKTTGEQVAVHNSNLTLLTGGTQRVTFEFTEALLDEGPYRAQCNVGSGRGGA